MIFETCAEDAEFCIEEDGEGHVNDGTKEGVGMEEFGMCLNDVAHKICVKRWEALECRDYGGGRRGRRRGRRRRGRRGRIHFRRWHAKKSIKEEVGVVGEVGAKTLCCGCLSGRDGREERRENEGEMKGWHDNGEIGVEEGSKESVSTIEL